MDSQWNNTSSSARGKPPGCWSLWSLVREYLSVKFSPHWHLLEDNTPKAPEKKESKTWMSCPSWQWHRTGSSWSPVRTLLVAPLWCDLGFVPNCRGNKAAANLRPTAALSCPSKVDASSHDLHWLHPPPLKAGCSLPARAQQLEGIRQTQARVAGGRHLSEMCQQPSALPGDAR